MSNDVYRPTIDRLRNMAGGDVTTRISDKFVSYNRNVEDIITDARENSLESISSIISGDSIVMEKVDGTITTIPLTNLATITTLNDNDFIIVESGGLIQRIQVNNFKTSL